MKVYLIGSLRNPEIPVVANSLRAEGFDVFDDWYAAGPEADDKWREYEQGRGRTMAEALKGEAARNTYEFDLGHLYDSDAVVLLAPAGKSGHLELGVMIGRGVPSFVYYPDGEPERWDVMYRFCNGVAYSHHELVEMLEYFTYPWPAPVEPDLKEATQTWDNYGLKCLDEG